MFKRFGFNSSLFETNHILNFNIATMLAHIHDKRLKSVQYHFYSPFIQDPDFSIYSLSQISSE